MFDSLSNSLQSVFRDLRGRGRLSEANIKEAMREVRMALLEADVNFQVARDFVKRVEAKCLGEDVLDSVTPGQQVVKRVQDELEDLLGGSTTELDLSGRPAVVLMIGLHGSGKTTTTGKLAHHWKQKGRNVALCAADIRRPAAVEQLSILAEQAGVDVIRPEAGESVAKLGRRAYEQAKKEWRDILFIDTGGRFQIEDDLVQELKDLKKAVQADHVLLVADAALGQESVDIASTFNEALGVTGLILTKLDGDARGGAALSIHSVTGCPIMYTGVGEHMEDLDVFHPDRMASRILGMGDIVSLVEKAEQTMDVESATRLQSKIRKRGFDFEDFLEQLQQVKKMGSMSKIMEMMPGGGMMDQLKQGMTEEVASQADDYTKKAEAIIYSMTPKERRNPKLINGSRRKRIAKGSGVQVVDVNDLLKKFKQSRKMMKKMNKFQKGLPKFP